MGPILEGPNLMQIYGSILMDFTDLKMHCLGLGWYTMTPFFVESK